MNIDPATGEVLNKPSTPTAPTFLGTLEELQGGILPAILTRALSDTAMAVAEQGDAKSKGTVTLEITLRRGKGQFALRLGHKIKYAHPTARGRKAEEASDESEVYVNVLGHVSVAPDTQGNLTF